MSARLSGEFRKPGELLHWDEVAFLRECGTPDVEIARRLGVKPESLHQAETRSSRRTGSGPVSTAGAE